METFTAVNHLGQARTVSVDQHPDECPRCHHAMTPTFHFAFYDENRWQKKDCLQIIYRCPRLQCNQLFIANHESMDSSCRYFNLSYLAPLNKNNKVFSNTIKTISPNFCSIYNQSFAAEQDGLMEICGVGYRKSIEFLIKDYLIKLNHGRKEEIEKKRLGDCLEQDIKNDSIKNIAKRATWLGNDETHYFRTWVGKDVQDLKRLIDLTVHWLEMEKLTEDIVTDMPDSKK